MASFTPIRDAANKIVDLAPRDQPGVSGFAALLQDTMGAVGAAPAHPTPAEETQAPRRPFGRRELAGIVCGLLLAAMLIALINRSVPATSTAPLIVATPTMQPTGKPAIIPALTPFTPTPSTIMVVGWAAPGGAVLGPVPLPAAATARFGDEWLGFSWNGGMIWVRRSDWPSASVAGLPDLTPPTPAPIVVWQPPAQPAAQSAPATPANEMPADRPAPPTRVLPFQMR